MLFYVISGLFLQISFVILNKHEKYETKTRHEHENIFTHQLWPDFGYNTKNFDLLPTTESVTVATSIIVYCEVKA